MKSIEFSEEQLSDKQGLASQLFSDEKDPRSPFYVRKLVRPKINWLRIFLLVTVPAVLAVVLVLFLGWMGMPRAWSVLVPFALLAVYALFSLKRAVICCVRIYQRYAPDSIRNRCRFEPSCSEYMIMAIEKYGLIKGVYKGIGRLKRCNINNGGFDYP